MRRTLAAAAMAAAVVLVLSVMVEAAGKCFLGGHLYNKDRRISEGGVIEAECPGNSPHSAPFGNWGVVSRFGPRTNKKQFAGWYPPGNGQWHWNSCTTDPEYEAPHQLYYNEPWAGPRVWQKSNQGSQRVGSSWLAWSTGQTCRVRWDNKVYTVDDMQMLMQELDWPDDDEHTATLGYGDVRIRLKCKDDWICEGDTDWMNPRSVNPSNSKVWARAYVLLKTAEK